MTKKNRWVIGDGAFVLNEDASMEILLSGVSIWLEQAQDLNLLLSKRLSLDSQDHQQTISTLKAIAHMVQLSLDCARRVRVQASYIETPDATYP